MKYTIDSAEKDLDKLVSFGVYSVKSPVNGPSGVTDWANVIVVPTNGSNVYVAQILVTHGGVISSVGSGETDVTLFTNEQFSSIVGRPFDQANDCVMAMSGEKDSINRFPISVSYQKRDKSLIARISSGSADMIRVNYLIITGA